MPHHCARSKTISLIIKFICTVPQLPIKMTTGLTMLTWLWCVPSRNCLCSPFNWQGPRAFKYPTSWKGNFYGNVVNKARKFKQIPLGLVNNFNKLIHKYYPFNCFGCIIWYQHWISAQYIKTFSSRYIFTFLSYMLHF